MTQYTGRVTFRGLSAEQSCMNVMCFCMLQDIQLVRNASLAGILNETFSRCDNTKTGRVDCRFSLQHSVAALATFDHVYAAPGRYWVAVWARGVVPGTNKSDTLSSNVSVAVKARPALLDVTGLVLLIVSHSSYVGEPLHLTVLIQNSSTEVIVTVECNDEAGRISLDVHKAPTTTTLREVIGSDRYRNRYRIAACVGPPNGKVDEATTTFSRLDAVHTFDRVGARPLTVTFCRKCQKVATGGGNCDRFTLRTVVWVRPRTSLADELGAVVIVARRPAYVYEPVEFVYAVQTPHPQLQYRLDFDDRLQRPSTVSVNRTVSLPPWVNRTVLELPKSLRRETVYLFVYSLIRLFVGWLVCLFIYFDLSKFCTI